MQVDPAVGELRAVECDDAPVNCAWVKVTVAPVKRALSKRTVPPENCAPRKSALSMMTSVKSRSWPCQERAAFSRRWAAVEAGDGVGDYA
jgi:hypothetical protein